MLPNHGDFPVRQEQYQDLLREAEQDWSERLCSGISIASQDG